MQEFSVVPPNPPNEGFLFVDHSRTGRSGHLGHALVEYEDGKILFWQTAWLNCRLWTASRMRPCARRAKKGVSALGREALVHSDH